MFSRPNNSSANSAVNSRRGLRIGASPIAISLELYRAIHRETARSRYVISHPRMPPCEEMWLNRELQTNHVHCVLALVHGTYVVLLVVY